MRLVVLLVLAALVMRTQTAGAQDIYYQDSARVQLFCRLDTLANLAERELCFRRMEDNFEVIKGIDIANFVHFVGQPVYSRYRMGEGRVFKCEFIYSYKYFNYDFSESKERVIRGLQYLQKWVTFRFENGYLDDMFFSVQ